jgi:hypothetical protein
VLLCLFSIAIAINLSRGRSDISCHCAGILGNQKLSWWQLLRNAGLLVCCLLLLWGPISSGLGREDIVVPMLLLATVVILGLVLFQQVRVHWLYLID